MRAAVLHKPGRALVEMDLPAPRPGAGQVLVRVSACAVCRTDLHVIDGDLTEAKLPIVPGHEVIGYVEAAGDGVQKLTIGERVGIPWLGATCGVCRYCKAGAENLCDEPGFTGYTLDGGFAEFIVANEDYCFPISGGFSDVEAAPLLCAGLIGHRSLKMAGESVARLGIFGFGAAAHIVTQVARFRGIDVYAFTRPGDDEAQDFALELGAVWAGGSDRPAPVDLDAAIIFAPVGDLLPVALASVRKGGTVVCGGIHMSDIPSFPYDILWGERTVRSVANLTRADAQEFLELAPQIPVKTVVERFGLSEVNTAIDSLRTGRLRGAAVIAMAPKRLP